MQRTDLIALKKGFFFRLDFYRMTVVGGLFRLRSINRLTTTFQQRYSIKKEKQITNLSTILNSLVISASFS